MTDSKRARRTALVVAFCWIAVCLFIAIIATI